MSRLAPFFNEQPLSFKNSMTYCGERGTPHATERVFCTCRLWVKSRLPRCKKHREPFRLAANSGLNVSEDAYLGRRAISSPGVRTR